MVQGRRLSQRAHREAKRRHYEQKSQPNPHTLTLKETPMVLNRVLLAFIAFVVAAVFFAIALFGGSLGDVNLIEAGFFSTAIGLALQVVPGP